MICLCWCVCACVSVSSSVSASASASVPLCTTGRAGEVPGSGADVALRHQHGQAYPQGLRTAREHEEHKAQVTRRIHTRPSCAARRRSAYTQGAGLHAHTAFLCNTQERTLEGGLPLSAHRAHTEPARRRAEGLSVGVILQGGVPAARAWRLPRCSLVPPSPKRGGAPLWARYSS